ncbi:hypothetical protein [Armatimonas rosea]|uniref:Uncharacterized protein n=1 Tax=Armatimonas rosea TaxID=685828 RepID=A0A7W9WAU3_ARMRO|nr:hypothetical protein [Armatimonas rosea]MBB6053972.1 hypothetical protein [Armatimonas rosea]
MDNELPINLFTALRLDEQALSQLHYCFDQMHTNTDSRTASFYRQAFARSVFSYFIAGSKLLWADTLVSNPRTIKPTQEDGKVFTNFLAIFHQHQDLAGKNIQTFISEVDNQLIKNTEERLYRVIYPNNSLDLTFLPEETNQLERVLWVIGSFIRS